MTYTLHRNISAHSSIHVYYFENTVRGSTSVSRIPNRINISLSDTDLIDTLKQIESTGDNKEAQYQNRRRARTELIPGDTANSYKITQNFIPFPTDEIKKADKNGDHKAMSQVHLITDDCFHISDPMLDPKGENRKYRDHTTPEDPIQKSFNHRYIPLRSHINTTPSFSIIEQSQKFYLNFLSKDWEITDKQSGLRIVLIYQKLESLVREAYSQNIIPFNKSALSITTKEDGSIIQKGIINDTILLSGNIINPQMAAAIGDVLNGMLNRARLQEDTTPKSTSPIESPSNKKTSKLTN